MLRQIGRAVDGPDLVAYTLEEVGAVGRLAKPKVAACNGQVAEGMPTL